MPSDAVKMLILAFIPCRLDYCNSLFNTISDGLMAAVCPACCATRLVSGARRYDHIISRCTVHWLPFQKRVGFNIATHLGLSFVKSGTGARPHGSGCTSLRPLHCRRRSAAFCRVEDLCRQVDDTILETDVSRLPGQQTWAMNSCNQDFTRLQVRYNLHNLC